MVKSGLANFGFAVLFGMAAWPLVSTFAPRIEGHFFPVTTHTQILSYLPKVLGSTEIAGKTNKIRSCDFERLEWFLEDDGSVVRADVEFLENTKARPSGDFNFGPWVVKLSAAEIENKSTAYVFHKCHPFWLTRTQFWP